MSLNSPSPLKKMAVKYGLKVSSEKAVNLNLLLVLPNFTNVKNAQILNSCLTWNLFGIQIIKKQGIFFREILLNLIFFLIFTIKYLSIEKINK